MTPHGTSAQPGRTGGEQLCRLYGLDIASELDLHARREKATSGVDVHVCLGETVSASTTVPPGDLMAQWSTDSGLVASFVRRPDASHLLRFESTCDVTIDSRAEHVTVHMVEGVPETMGGVLVGGTVLSYLLLLRDEVVLHASAVDIGGRAIAFVGSSGMGKSTMATLMCRDGGLLITDDVLRVTRDEDGVDRCALGATELRLRAAASGLADQFAEGGSHRSTADDRRALSVPVCTDEGLPLAALFIPRPRRASPELSLTRLHTAAAALSLLSFPRILGIRDSRLLARQFEQMTDLAERVPVFLADVPWGPPFQDNLSETLLAALDEEIGERATTGGAMDAPQDVEMR
ncbi:hypothetical protein EXE58_03475 [Nocardioides seonyuensis]|uniref:HPr kinase/phosphorylase C-terminal domain-containing protein n=1 Tax=Nocardioides seonyuensis TaxID=2518371 RepID=A0A4P7ID79_9ACTN|nr:hypothetical protein [Nocardioides seonyuensis]QBX54620.1 hypothetical protein EXE58_03475 [Nocardioides seonyuensis]